MRRTLFLALLVPVTLTAYTQSLDVGNVPVIGDAWTYVSCGPVMLDGTGAEQTWDASGATSNAAIQGVQCVSPLNTTAGEFFTEADIALDYNGTTTYLQADADGMYLMGSYVAALDITSTYTDPLRQFVFPAPLDATWSDEYAGSYTYNSEIVDQNGEMSCTVSGVGDLILPWGTVENVLRLDISELYTEVGLGNTFVMDRTMSEFYRPGLRTYLARMYAVTNTLNGTTGNTSEGFLYVEEDALTGMTDAAQHAIGMEVFPNPASERCTVILAANGPVSLQVYDATGKLVLQQRPSASSGLIKATLDLQDLPTGVYSARVQSRNGDTGSTRLVVTR